MIEGLRRTGYKNIHKNGITPFGVHAYEKYYRELEEIINSQKESI